MQTYQSDGKDSWWLNGRDRWTWLTEDSVADICVLLDVSVAENTPCSSLCTGSAGGVSCKSHLSTKASTSILSYTPLMMP
jgi:hypothetical protein